MGAVQIPKTVPKTEINSDSFFSDTLRSYETYYRFRESLQNFIKLLQIFTISLKNVSSVQTNKIRSSSV
jgi:hypothetical protein